MVLLTHPSIINDFFSLSIRQKSSEMYLCMKLFTPAVNTASIPQTYDILLEILPGIYTANCFNDANLPFASEVKRTEIGHLFEHILLEYIYQIKSVRGEKNTMVKGETSWNWKRDPRGMFHIIINIGIQDAPLFPLALRQSIRILQIILLSNKFAQPGCRTEPGYNGFYSVI